MQPQQILALMTEINEKYNLILANAKTIDELEEQLDLLANSFVAVRVGGVTQKLQVQKIIDAVQTFAVNEMVSIGAITVDGNDVTIPAGAQWRINGVNLFSSEPTVINIPFAATGKIRTDIVVANSGGNIVKVTGTETDTGEIAVRPPIPFNSVLVTQINVTDASFDTIVETIGEAPIDGNMYGRKDGAWEQITGGPITTPNLQTRLLSVGAISVVSNTVSVASASALILGVEVINTEGISFMVPFATTGKIRIDLVVLNSDGDLLRISGTETDSGNIAVPPINLVPPTAVIVTEINVTDTDLVTIIPTYLSFDEEQAIHNANNPSASNPFATVNDTTLFKVLSQGDRPIRMSDGDGDTMLELDDRGKLVYNIDGDFLHLPAELHPDTSVLKIHNLVDSDLFLIPTDDVPYTIISGLYIDEFSGITLKKGTAVLTKVNDFEWLLTYELLDFSKEALGLENVNNTSDMEKPLSTPQAAAIRHVNYISVLVAADVNITPLSGPRVIQGWSTGDSSVILLTAQENQTENGLWQCNFEGAWTRPYQHQQISYTLFTAFVQRGTYAGRNYRISGAPGSNITVTELTDSKLKPSIGSDTKSTMTQKAISDELAKKVSFWGSAIDGASVANTLTITATYSQLIPANTFVAGDNIFLNFRATSPGAKTSASSIYFYVNTANNLSGATQLGIYTGPTTSRTLQADRVLSVKGSTTKTINPSASLSTDVGASAAMTSHTIDWTVNQYIIFAIGHTVNDQTMFGDFYSIEKK